MIVLRASDLGMCFGVRDALGVLDQVAVPAEVTIHGELVHNPLVLRSLAARGFASVPEASVPGASLPGASAPQGRRAMPATPAVMVTAHGISERERSRLVQAGKRVLDTTCPLVAKAHVAARALVEEGRQLVVFGQRGHVEVQGIVEDHDGAVVFEAVQEVRGLAAAALGVMCQTTLPEARAQQLLQRLVATNPTADIRFVDTICAPTKARQRALLDLLEHVDVLVVVGGHNSNNTKRLAATAQARGIAAMHVEGPADLDLDALRAFAVVGLTAGTSTLPQTVDAVEAALRGETGGLRQSPS